MRGSSHSWAVQTVDSPKAFGVVKTCVGGWPGLFASHMSANRRQSSREDKFRGFNSHASSSSPSQRGSSVSGCPALTRTSEKRIGHYSLFLSIPIQYGLAPYLTFQMTFQTGENRSQRTCLSIDRLFLFRRPI